MVMHTTHRCLSLNDALKVADAIGALLRDLHALPPYMDPLTPYTDPLPPYTDPLTSGVGSTTDGEITTEKGSAGCRDRTGAWQHFREFLVAQRPLAVQRAADQEWLSAHLKQQVEVRRLGRFRSQS